MDEETAGQGNKVIFENRSWLDTTINMPLLFAVPMWTFPYWYLYPCALTLLAVGTMFKVFGFRAVDFIPLNTLTTVFLWFPVFLFFFLIAKSREFRAHCFYLPLLWMFLYFTMGMTQGSLVAALSKVYSVGQ